MKIGFFVSAIKALSAWLHGEGGKYFRTYTYPKIRSFTRRFINLGIYERFEHLYKIVDDTFYTGVIDDDPQMPSEVFAAELLAQEMEDGSVITDAAETLPRFEDIRDQLFIWQSLEQKRTYRCVTFTVNNMLRSAMLQMGLKPPLEVTSIDPLYIATKVGPGKTGTNSAYIMEYLARGGYPMPSWTPHMTDHNKELQDLENSDFAPNAHKFVCRLLTGNAHFTRSFSEALKLDSELPLNWQMQVSINFSASLKWFGQSTPFVQKIGDKYNLTRTGGHSVHAVRNSFSTGEDGEAGFGIIDSAYRSAEDGFRFVSKRLVDLGVIKIRFVEFNLEGVNEAPPTNIPTPPIVIGASDEAILSTTNISYGDKGENVKALQRFLIAEGYFIAAGVTGNFLNQTKSTLKAWQDITFGPKYSGEFWGAISQAEYKRLKGI